MYNDQNLDPKCKCRTINFITNCFSQVNVGNKISPLSTNCRASSACGQGREDNGSQENESDKKGLHLEIQVLNMLLLSCLPLLFIAAYIRRELL